MKLIRQRRPSVKTMLGITKAKRRVAKLTGIPTTRSGRKRKALNTLTGGAYGKYTRARAAVNRPWKLARRMGCGCLVTVLQAAIVVALAVALLLL